MGVDNNISRVSAKCFLLDFTYVGVDNNISRVSAKGFLLDVASSLLSRAQELVPGSSLMVDETCLGASVVSNLSRDTWPWVFVVSLIR